MSKPAKLAVVQINSQACYIKNVFQICFILDPIVLKH